MTVLRFLLLPACLLVFSMAKCRKSGAGEIPKSIAEKIKAIQAQPVWNPPARVEAYQYKGETVYLFTAPCCDQYIQVFDEKGQLICSPSGGFSGKGDGRCAGFYDEATQKRLIWEDKR